MITIKLKQAVRIGGVVQPAESNVIVDESFAATLISEYKAYPPDGWNVFPEFSNVGGIVAVTASRSATLSDAGNILECNSASAVNITVEPDSTTNHPINTIITIYQVGAGASLFVAGAGVTIQGTAPTATQYTHIAVRKRAANTWAWV